MQVYVALLRGINVSGKNMIKMAELTALFESLGYKNVQTYVQSGNVVFESKDDDTVVISDKIEKALKSKYGYDVSVLSFIAKELKDIIKNNPLSKQDGISEEYLHVTLLKDTPDKDKLAKFTIIKDDNEIYIINGRTIYLYCPNGYGRTKLTNNIFEKKLGVSATTRNWKTISKLLEMINVV